jgi:hypothetical protein
MKQIILTVLLAALASGVASAQHPETPPASRPGKGAPEDHSAHAGHHGGTGGMLMVETEPAQAMAGSTTTLKLMIHGEDGGMIKDYEVVHEKKVHLIVVRDGLDQFDHVHPEIDEAGNMTVSLTFPKGGLYRLYADYKPAKKQQVVATAEVKVAGESAAAPALKPDVPGKVKGDGLDADIAVTGTKSAAPVTFTFRVLDASGQPVKDLQPYLGAMGHLVLISSDGKEYVHVHPEDKPAAEGKVGFEANFPKPGLYKGWGQFQRAGKVHAVPFVIRID